MYNTSSKSELAERLRALQDLSVELLKERNPNRLLSTIVKKAMSLLISDAGSLYLKGEDDFLHFEVSKNYTLKYKFEKQKINLGEKGLAFWSYHHCKSLRIDDVYSIAPDLPYKFDYSFDQMTGYRTKSVLTYPLYSSKNEILGVIQIINRKKYLHQPWNSKDPNFIQEMPCFTEEDEELLKSFASIASAALENSGLYKNIKNLLEGFVKASVGAIESRDLATCGHSERVAMLTVSMAQIIDRSNEPPFRNIRFSDQQIEELRYASLLHDFGKIAVRENVLLKSEKLYEWQKKVIESRFKEFGHIGEIKLLREMLEMLQAQSRGPTELEMARLKRNIDQIRSELSSDLLKITSLSGTTVLDVDNSREISALKNKHFEHLDGSPCPLLEDKEIEFLSIKRGSLSEDEREEINKHVSHTYYFLKEIPWTKDLRNLPEIAYAHHEKLDGTGYPRRLKDAEIPYQSKIMAITDIFDALAAMDRPYKKAVPIPKALEILEMEARQGKLDVNIVKAFIESKMYLQPKFIKKMGPIATNIKDKKAA